MENSAIMSMVGLPGGLSQYTSVATVTRPMNTMPVRPRLPRKILSDIQPHSSVPGIPAHS